ncbi:MAG TPA: PilZ domain-containing protein, partial [Gemmataceae bacterium]|nr:PilZ domain-containing protein [Gemmataceae bacterium]
VGWPGRVRDISLGGVGLLLRHRFRPGTILEVELRSNTGALLRAVSVRVVHATAVLMDGNPCWHLGCAFPQPLSDEEFRELSS